MSKKDFLRNVIRFFMTPALYAKIRYFLSHRRFLVLKNPVTYTEKIQYRKFITSPHRFHFFVDKIKAKDYIDSLGLPIYTPLTLATFDNLCVNDFTKFESKPFVLKTNHGGGGKFVDIVESINDVDVVHLVNKYNKLVKLKVGSTIDEYFYDLIQPKIFIEENLNYLVNGSLLDYKFHVFNGKVEFIQINKRKSMTDYTMTLVDRDFIKLPFTLDHTLSSEEQTDLFKPKLFDEALRLTETICSDFNYVRFDLYIANSLIVFSEFTFCPASGWSRVSPSKYDYILGKLWDLNKEI